MEVKTMEKSTVACWRVFSYSVLQSQPSVTWARGCCRPCQRQARWRNASGKRREKNQTTPRNKDARAQGHDKGSKTEVGGCSSLRVRVQLTEGAGLDVDDEFSWCWNFNRRVCKGDGSCPKSHIPKVPLYRGSSLNLNPGWLVLSHHTTHDL